MDAEAEDQQFDAELLDEAVLRLKIVRSYLIAPQCLSRMKHSEPQHSASNQLAPSSMSLHFSKSLSLKMRSLIYSDAFPHYKPENPPTLRHHALKYRFSSKTVNHDAPIYSRSTSGYHSSRRRHFCTTQSSCSRSASAAEHQGHGLCSANRSFGGGCRSMGTSIESMWITQSADISLRALYAK